MWQDEQRRKDSNGKRWNFRIWADVWTEDKVLMAERVFFWDDSKSHCGVVLFKAGSDVHFSRLKQLIGKLVSTPTLREQHRRHLRFPLERYYSDYGAFPEENQSDTRPTPL
jgi:hypothetical protein